MTKVDYNPTNSLLHAASRDRVIYQWRWPENKEEEEEVEGEGKANRSLYSNTSETAQEPVQKLEGHTLGVTALSSTSGECPPSCPPVVSGGVCEANM